MRRENGADVGRGDRVGCTNSARRDETRDLQARPNLRTPRGSCADRDVNLVAVVPAALARPDGGAMPVGFRNSVNVLFCGIVN